jgi:hypothetical protein
MSELTTTYAGWHPDLLRLYPYSARWYKWALYDRDPVERWSKGRALLALYWSRQVCMRALPADRTSKNADIAMATFLKIFIVVLLVVLLAHAFIGWLRPDVTPGLSFLPGDIKYESPGGNVRVYFPIVTSIVLSVVLTMILRLFGRFFGR